MGFMKWSNDEKLKAIHWMMCFLNLTIILFISVIMYITTLRICDMYEARTFLSTLPCLPSNPLRIMITSVACFPILLFVMRLRHQIQLTTWKLAGSFLLETCLCLIIMQSLSFSTNSILLLVMADLLTYISTNRERALCLAVMIVIYLCGNYDFLSGRFAIVSFNDYLACYNSMTQSVLSSIHNTLASLNIIMFILYMIFLVQEKINESKKFLQMNQYANIREKMGATRERNRLAREIHDTLGHTLTGLSVGIDACVLMSEIDPAATKNQLSTLAETARNGLKDVRRSVDKLRPDALEHYTLKEALDKMIQEFQGVTDVVIHFVCHLPHLTFDKDEEEVIYRIIQEGMTNAVRHGKAKEIFISIAKENDTLILIIEDDGIGCETIKPDFGLHHMQERIALLQGDIRFYGSNGFVILAEIPIREGI